MFKLVFIRKYQALKLTMNKIYPTDLTDNQWQYIEKTLLFEERKRKHELKEIFNGIFYLVKTGCQWRMLPK